MTVRTQSPAGRSMQAAAKEYIRSTARRIVALAMIGVQEGDYRNTLREHIAIALHDFKCSATVQFFPEKYEYVTEELQRMGFEV